jgi:hypothetical protein
MPYVYTVGTMYSTCGLVNGCEVSVAPIKMFGVLDVVGVGVGRWECPEINDGNGNVSMYGAIEGVDTFVG